MIRRTLCLLAALSVWLSMPQAGQVSYFAQVETYTDVWNYQTGEGLYTPVPVKVTRWTGDPSRLTSVTIQWRENCFGYTGIENPQSVAWNGTSIWTTGWDTKLEQPDETPIGKVTRNFGWFTNTTQDMGMMYNSVYVGDPQPFDGSMNWTGPSGRSWNIRGEKLRSITTTTNLAKWAQGGPDGKHAFVMEVEPFEKLLISGFVPGHTWRKSQAWVSTESMIVTYNFN